MSDPGIDGTLDLVCARLYRPQLAANLEKSIRTYGRCVRTKSPCWKERITWSYSAWISWASSIEVRTSFFVFLLYTHFDPSSHTHRHSHCRMLPRTLQLNVLYTSVSLHCSILTILWVTMGLYYESFVFFFPWLEVCWVPVNCWLFCPRYYSYLHLQTVINLFTLYVLSQKFTK